MRIVSSIVSGAVLSVAAVIGLIALPTAAAGAMVYDNIPNPQPSNLPSLGYEATSTSEFGGQIALAGIERTNLTLKVLMSSWGCESGSWNEQDCVTAPGSTFSHPITANVYAVGTDDTVGSLIATSTKTFDIAYRPSASTECGDGRWWDGAACFNGFGVPLVFNNWSSNAAWPDNVIVTFAYNTSHYGETPLNEGACMSESGGCGYDSLNVGLSAPPTVGTLPLPGDAYLDSTWSGAYCDEDTLDTGSLRLDAGCWTGYQPAIEVVQVVAPTSKDQCKKDGWKVLVDKNGNSFKNQGLCVASVESSAQSKHNRQ